MHLDEIDWKLIRELYSWVYGNYPTGPLRISLGELSSKVELHPKTVKLRLRAMRNSGVIDGPYFEPRPRLLDLFRSAFMFEVPHLLSSDDLESALLPLPSVETVVFGRRFAFVIFWHEDARPTPELVSQLSEKLHASAAWKSYSTADFPNVGSKASLSPIDWHLILALRRHPAKSMASVARELGITSRQAERRARNLIERDAGAMVTRFLISRIEGWIYVHYVVKEGDARALSSLADAFPDRIVGPFSHEIRPNVGVAVASLDEAERRRLAAEKLPGIKSLSLYMVRNWIYPKAFEVWLKLHVEKWQNNFRQREIHHDHSHAHDNTELQN